MLKIKIIFLCGGTGCERGGSAPLDFTRERNLLLPKNYSYLRSPPDFQRLRHIVLLSTKLSKYGKIVGRS